MKCIECNEKESEEESGWCTECKKKRDEIWNTCKHCGAKDKENKDNYVINSCCSNCSDKIDKKIDFKSAQEDGCVTRDESIMCPYCGYVLDIDTQEYHDSKEFDCPECEKKSDLSVEYTTHWTTTKKEPNTQKDNKTS